MGHRIVIIYHESQKSALGNAVDLEYNEETVHRMCELSCYNIPTLLQIHDKYANYPGKTIFVYLAGAWCFGDEDVVCRRLEEWIRGGSGICIAAHQDLPEGCRSQRYPQCARGVICTRIDPVLLAYVTMLAWQHTDSLEVALQLAADAEKLIQ